MSMDRPGLSPDELQAEGAADLPGPEATSPTPPRADPLPLAGAGGPVGGPVAGEVLDALNQPVLPRDDPRD